MTDATSQAEPVAGALTTLAQPHEFVLEVKRSRFVARVSRADTRDEALAFVARVRVPTATHNCWAYRIGDEYRFSDDGEPGGTAGRPMLAAIDSQGLQHVVAVVSRDFGGIKLGAGGLVRAYGGVVAECLRTARRETLVPEVEVVVRCPFPALGSLHHALASVSHTKLDEAFDDTGVVLRLSLAAHTLEALRCTVADLTRGQARFEVADSDAAPLA